MLITVKNSAPFQILTSAMVIGPSQTGYQLEVAADGRNFSPLFSVGPNVTRQATNLSSGAYYRLNGNVGDVVVNWRTSCVTEGGAAGNELTPVTEFPLNADPGTVVALASGDTYGIYQYDGTNWNEAGADVDLSAYWTSAQTQSAITAVEDHLFDFEEVTSSALTELHEGLLEVSGRTVDLSNYATSGDMQSAFTLISETQHVAAAGLNQLEGRIDELSGNTPDMSAYWTSAETQDAIDEAISGFTPSANSPIIPAITTQAEYEAISGDVKTGDLIQVNNVDINGDNNLEYGLFEAYVEEVEEEGVMRKFISWGRRDNSYSIEWSNEDYPWMVDNDVHPIVLPRNSFFMAFDELAEDEEYNGIGFDGDGKLVITHIAQAYDDETGITRTDTNMVSSTSVSTIWRGTQAEYDAITTKDPNTFYIIVNN